MAKVSLKNVSKIYRCGKEQEIAAVTNLTLEVNDRELVVIVGPTGCGKSSTLRMIAGLEEISEGEVSIGDQRVNEVAAKDRDIAMVFQNYALYPHMTVYENLAFGLKLRKFPKDEIGKRVKEAANILGLESYLDRKSKALSGGQRQRVAVGRAMVRQPKVFLFDEPLSNLDARMRVQMRMEITKLHWRLKATMIYVTHDQGEAMTMGDRIVVMKEGVVQQYDAPLNIYYQPVNTFVAGFMGNPPMNFIKGRLKDGAGGVTFKEVEEGSIEVKFGARSELKPWMGKEVILGIRPENIRLVRDPNQPANLRFPAIVDLVEPMGAETNIYFQTGAHTAICRSAFEINHDEAGRRHRFEMEEAKIHFFDPETTQRIAPTFDAAREGTTTA